MNKRKFNIYAGGGVGYYFYDQPKFVNHKGSLMVNAITKYKKIALSTYITASPLTNFGTMLDVYLNLGLCFNIKNTLLHLYAGTNLAGQASKKYTYYYEGYPNDIHEVTYSNLLNGINPGIQITLFTNKKYSFFINTNLYSYHFYEPYQRLPYKYADRYPPYSGKNINILLGVNFKIR